MYETFDGRGNFHGLHHRLFIAVTVPSTIVSRGGTG